MINQSSKNDTVTLSVENIICSVDLGTEIKLSKLLEKYKDIEEKSKFPGIVAKISKPKATILIFKSGKLVITGFKLMKVIPQLINIIKEKIQKANIHLPIEPIVNVENIVVRGDFHQTINLDLTSLTLSRAIYEPEVFPGLIYKIFEPYSLCFLLFTSGKMICTGAKDLNVIKKAVKMLGMTLKNQDLFNTTPYANENALLI